MLISRAIAYTHAVMQLCRTPPHTFTQFYDPKMREWSSRGMYIRSLYTEQLQGNQRGSMGLLVTCVSNHMTDMQFSNRPLVALEVNSVSLHDVNLELGTSDNVSAFEGCNWTVFSLKQRALTPTSDYGVNKELVPLVQAGIFLSVVILAVFARVADRKAAVRVQRVAHNKCVLCELVHMWGFL